MTILFKRIKNQKKIHTIIKERWSMLDIKRLRSNKEEVKTAMKIRGEAFDLEMIDKVVALDEKRREIIAEVEALKNKRNTASQEIPKLKKAGQNADDIMAEMKKLADEIKSHDEELNKVDEEIEYILMRIPNIPHPDVPQGATDEDNLELRKWGEPSKFDFDVKAHWDIGTNLGLLDFEAA